MKKARLLDQTCHLDPRIIFSPGKIQSIYSLLIDILKLQWHVEDVHLMMKCNKTDTQRRG